MPSPKSGWYFCADVWKFYGFRQLDCTTNTHGPYPWAGELHGPYGTFNGAKAGALSYYRARRKLISTAVAEINKSRSAQLTKGDLSYDNS